MQHRTAARDALLARGTAIGAALTVLAAAATGAVTGWVARPEPVSAQPSPAVAVTDPVPRPRRTVYLRVVVRPQAPPAARTRVGPPRRAAPRPPVVAPQRAGAAPVARTAAS